VNAFNALAVLLAHDLVPHPDFSPRLTKTTRRFRKQLDDVTKTRMAIALLARHDFRAHALRTPRSSPFRDPRRVAQDVRCVIHKLRKFFWENGSREPRATRIRVRAPANR
jgi:hypothetical protein